MKNILRENYLILLITSLSCSLLVVSCSGKSSESSKTSDINTVVASGDDTYTNPLLEVGAEPWAIFHDGYYYYTHGCENRIKVWKTKDITDLANATCKEVWIPTDPKNAHHLWGPEIHYIDNKWYIYYSADDGQMDNHQLYVIENENADPLDGEFKMKGHIRTDRDNNWAIHASVFQHNDELYMIWSGWETRRIEIETQCIYISKMKNSWELSSDRVLISKPEYEWERQWINPDGSKTAYPIYVNEAPQYFQTRDKNKVLIYYSASGNWTPYYAVGLLSANADSDLLDPKSWTKNKDAVFRQDNEVYGPGNLSFITSPNGNETFFLYHARDKKNDPSGAVDSRSPRLQKLEWDSAGYPILGSPLSVNTVLRKPL